MRLTFDQIQLLIELERYERSKSKWNGGLLAKLFDKQKEFILDKNKRKAALCSRQCGKSYGIALDLCNDLLDPTEGDVGYVGLTRGTAKKVMFRMISRLNDTLKLDLTPRPSELAFLSERTGNTLWMTGANTEDEAEKIRGLTLKKCVLDEVASFRSHINYLIEEVIEPTLIAKDGSLVLIGTPSANPGDNYFYKVTSGMEAGWSVHGWTILDNPHIPHAGNYLEQMRVRKQWTEDNPIYRREWLGQWTLDGDSLVYKYKKDRQDYTELPKGPEWMHILGIDLGFDDAFAITVIAFSYQSREAYVVDQFKHAGMIPEKMAAAIKGMKAKYNPVKSMADCGGLGKSIVEEFNRRYFLNITPAEKSQKAAAIEIINGELLSGKIKIKWETPLAKEMLTHQWDPERPGKEDDRTENDICDSFLYAARETLHYLGKDYVAPPLPNTEEWFNLEQKKMFEQELEALKNQDYFGEIA